MGKYRARYNETTGAWKKRRLDHRDSAIIGLALEHAASCISKWTIAEKYAGLVKKDSEKVHEAENNKRRYANLAVRNMNSAVRELGTALKGNLYAKAGRIAQDILLQPTPTPADFDQEHGKFVYPKTDYHAGW